MNTVWQRLVKLKETKGVDKKAELIQFCVAVLIVLCSRVVLKEDISWNTLQFSVLLVLCCRIIYFVLID